MKSPITTHVLDTMLGKPAAGVRIRLEKKTGRGWKLLAAKRTNKDGRIPDLLAGEKLRGTYRLRFDTASYFKATRRACFYPYVEVVFTIAESSGHYHVPLLLSPFGYSTYRGS